ncbi:response regulator [Lichenifustis flavocetrariae]|uniref:Response regulator n=1 Tax=Lichenifustis flavocetrariae TaxID=2949735 RepID=A0AA41YXQ3_9HYPH|nr:response regulator [Lichenifustis flavocetrariae]MCW6510059.1 response regulator [Lichenifustis flavocetrariae]
MNLRVLVVEDEALIALNLICLLEDLGHLVLGPAATSAQALALASEGGIDLAFVDLNLLDGATGASVARALASNPETTVVVVSATPAGLTAGEDGIFQIVKKPYADQTITQVVSLVARRRADDKARRER